MIPTTLKAAYAAADLIVASEPVFNVESARANKGRIVQWAVDLAFQKLVESGQWGNGFLWRSFERPTGRYLEIQLSHSALTISQVADPSVQPRDVGFRRNKRLASQITMKEILGDETDSSGIPHILLLHRHQSLDFAYLAIPDPLHWFGFQHKSANLMLMAHAVPTYEASMEDTDMEAVMTIKEEIDKWRRDNQSD
jgi:hypothetical protein